MKAIQACGAILVLLTGTAVARADGALYKLPKDGAWATYQIEFYILMSPMHVMQAKGTMRMASVGQATEDGQPCRWIEVNWKMAMNEGLAEKPREEKDHFKVLVPEKFLAKGESPTEHVIRGWRQRSGGKPEKLKDPGDIDEGPFPLVLCGPPKDLKNLPKQEVESKLGKLSCQRVAGHLEFESKHGGAFKCDVENCLHADAPFGLVSAHWKLDVPGMGEKATGDWTMKLIDCGEGGKSEMPEAK
jgi:hypothetical protein